MGASEQRMFRKAALEKLSSPERLDVMMQVTSPAGWLALSALGLVLVLVVLWSIFGWIPIKVSGQGILIRGGAMLAVTADSVGRLSQVLVTPGEVIQQGQLVAKVNQEDLMLRIRNQQALLADMRKQTGAFSTDTMERQLREKIANQQSLVDRGMLTRSSLMATQEQLNSLLQQGAGRQTNVDQMRRNIQELENQLASASKVESPYAGRVVEVTAGVGELIQPGMRIFTLEELNAPIDVVMYIPAAEGKKVRPEMPVRVSPSTVKAEEYGFMIGKVSKVSDYPVTPEGLARVLRNDNLVAALAGAGAPIEIKVQLIPDPDTPSGFKWSSSKGPPNKVYSGTLCSGAVVVERKRPISYILPIFKNALGAN